MQRIVWDFWYSPRFCSIRVKVIRFIFTLLAFSLKVFPKICIIFTFSMPFKTQNKNGTWSFISRFLIISIINENFVILEENRVHQSWNRVHKDEPFLCYWSLSILPGNIKKRVWFEDESRFFFSSLTFLCSLRKYQKNRFSDIFRGNIKMWVT